MKKVAFFIRTNDVTVASNRYRIYSPAIYLRNLGYETSVHLSQPTKTEIDETSVAIFGKSVSLRQLSIAIQFKIRRKKVYLDLCDNVFHESYYDSGDKEDRSSALRALVSICDGVLVPGAAMKALVAKEVSGRVPIHIIPDPVEKLSDIALMEDLAACVPATAEKAAGPKPAPSAQPLSHPASGERPRFLERIRASFARPRPEAEDQVPVEADAATAVAQPAAPAEHGTADRLAFGDGLPPTVVWFGNAGNGYSSFGLRSLALIMPEIVAAARQVPLRLLVVSNSERLYADLIEPFPVETIYRPWSMREIYAYVRQSDVCVLPLFDDEFSRGKSNNRILLSLAQGTPVVASQANAPLEMRGNILVEDWANSLKRYLTEPGTVEEHLAGARSALEAFSPQRCAELLAAVIDAPGAKEPDAAGPMRERFVFLIQFAADYALLQPLWRAAAETQAIDSQIVVLSSVLHRDEWIAEALRQDDSPVLVLGEKDVEALRPGTAFVRSIDALVTASETTLRPHRVAHRLTSLVNEAGGATFTLQHGLENVGLTYADERQGAEVRFASQHVLTWGAADVLGAFVADETRAKVLPVGITKSLRGTDPVKVEPFGGPGYIAIFENLHWLRYDDRFRERFLADLAHALADFPGERFVLKPHPAGKWLTERYKGDVPAAANLLVLDPAARGVTPVGGEDLAANAKLVLSTPSTVVLDAAREDVPVALIDYDLEDTAIYGPIPRLRHYDDWAAFIRSASEEPGYGRAARQDFLKRSVALPPLGMTVVDKALQTIRSHLR